MFKIVHQIFWNRIREQIFLEAAVSGSPITFSEEINKEAIYAGLIKQNTV